MKTVSILLLCYLIAYCQSIATKAYNVNGGMGDLNTRFSNDPYITRANAANLRLKFSVATSGDVTATPAVGTINGIDTAYFPDWAGYLYAVNVETGALIWKRKLSTYAGAQGNAVSRTSVTLTTDGNLIFCDQIGAIVYSVRAIDGVLNWSKKVNTHQFSQITMSPMVYYNPNYPAQPHMVLVGANSGEEGWIGAGVPNYVCCNFRGSMHGLNLATGEIMWTTWMLPDNFGWTNMTSGAGVWGANPPVDYARKLVYINTGNSYKVSAAEGACLASGGGLSCHAAGDHSTSILAINILDGSIKWATKVNSDVWNAACAPYNDCMGSPGSVSLDFDFAQGCMAYTYGGVDLLACAQKSGTVWILNRDTGAIVKGVYGGPGNSGGGMMFGSSMDDNNIYIANNNAGSGTYWTSDGKQCNKGIFIAIRKSDYSTAWSVCNPTGGFASGPTAVISGGVVFVGSRDPKGMMYALDATNGAVLWQYQSGATNAAGAAITNGLVLWGSGYSRYGLGTAGFKLYVFETPARYPADQTLAPTTTTTEAPTTPAPTLPPNTVIPQADENGAPAFMPAALTINLGETVNWMQLQFHNVYQTAGPTGAVPKPNGINNMNEGGLEFHHTFVQADIDNNGGSNIFYFRCSLHVATMLNVITVTLPQGVTAKPTTTTTAAPTFGGDSGAQAACPAIGAQSTVYNSDGNGIRYFIDELPIPPVIAPTSSTDDADEYDVTIGDAYVKIHSDLPTVPVRAYNGLSPGPTFEIQQNRKVIVNWLNGIKADTKILPNVETVPEGMSTTGVVTHLHGGDTDPGSDGIPEYTVEIGDTFRSTYQNHMQPATLFYHDHAMGITRSNVYMGLSGFYLISAPSELNLNLPNKEHEIPMLIQDKVVAPNANNVMELYYPTKWTMAWYGEVMMVNGIIWPYRNVDATVYRLRIVNGGNSRFLNLQFSNGMSFTVISNDQGYLTEPARVSNLLLAPAERADILVDFCNFAGKQIILTNDANAPYPGTDASGTDPCLQGRIALFNVGPSLGGCTNFDPAPYANAETSPAMKATMDQSIQTRDVVLQVNDTTLIPFLGIRGPKGPILYHYEDPPTEYAQNNTVEIWRIINTTPDTHPIHLHIAAFQVLTRQAFNVNLFKTTGALTFTADAENPTIYESGPKDVVRADPGVVTSILVKFSEKTGRYMWHCHMLEHEENAMMRPLIVLPNNQKTPDKIIKPSNAGFSLVLEGAFLIAVGILSLALT